jgi:hypothetical protein
MPAFAETLPPAEFFLIISMSRMVLSISIRISGSIALILCYWMEMHEAIQINVVLPADG